MNSTQQHSVSQILKELEPENLVAEAAIAKQTRTTSVMPKRLAMLPIPQDQKAQIHSGLLKDDSADPHKILQLAFNKHTVLETMFYQDTINQSRQSFIVALVAAAIAVLAFLVAIVILLVNGTASNNIATITTIGGAIAGLISGVNFYLYGMTSTQFASFHSRLDRMQRFSLAEYICELLGTEKATAESARDKALATVIANLASSSLADNPTYITPLAPPSAPSGQNGQGGEGGDGQNGKVSDGQNGKVSDGQNGKVSDGQKSARE